MNENANAIERFIVDEIHGGSDLDSISADEDLLATDLIDSLGISQLVTFLDERFGVVVADEDLTPENFRTIGTIAAFVERQTG